MTTPVIQRDPGPGVQRIYLTQPEHIDRKKVEKAALALAAGFLVYRKLVSRHLQNERPQLGNERQQVKSLWLKFAPVWLRLAAPAVKEAISAVTLGELSQEELEYIAASYANDLGQYVHETSADALVDGFHDQLAAKWGEVLSWHRAASAYGLDSQQMRAYVRAAINPSEKNQVFQLLPDAARIFIDKALLTRAERIGDHEAWQAMESGKAIAWMVQQRDGRISADAQKEWRTAEDERTCPVCRPLDRKRVGLEEQWEAIDGRKFWAPGIHPRCRCNIRLVYPEITDDPWSSTTPFQYPSKTDDVTLVQKDMPNDPYDRDNRGRFAPREERTRRYRPVRTQDEPRMSTEQLFAQAAAEQGQIKASVRNQADQVKAALGGGQIRAATNQVKASLATKATGGVKATQQTKASQAKGSEVKFGNRTLFVYHLPPAMRQKLVVVDGTPTPVSSEEDVPPDLVTMVWGQDWLNNDDGEDYSQELAEIQLKLRATLGAGISFDHPSDAVTIGRPFRPNHYAYLNEAAERYLDDDDQPRRWTDDAVLDARQEYHDAWDEWVQNFDFEEGRELAVNALTDEEVIQIAANSGSTARSVDLLKHDRDRLQDYKEGLLWASDQRLDALIMSIEDKHPKIFDTYFGNVERHGGGANPGQRLLNAKHDLENLGVREGIPTIFVIPEQHTGQPIDFVSGGKFDQEFGDYNMGMKGDYQIVGQRLVSANLLAQRSSGDDESSARPPQVRGLRLVFLSPVVTVPEDDEEGMSGDEWRKAESHEENWTEWMRVFQADDKTAQDLDRGRRERERWRDI